MPESDSAAAGAATVEIDLTAEPVQRAIQEAVARTEAAAAEALRGLKANRDALLTEKKAAVDEATKLKDQLAAGAIGTTNEKVEELLKERYGRALSDGDAKVQSLDQKLAEERADKERISNLLRERAIDAEVSIVSGSLEGFEKTALADATLWARTMFQLDENGVPVARDSSGKPVFGTDGKTPLTIKDWMTGLRSTKPHWFRAGVNGGGAAGGAGGAGGASYVIKRSDATDVARYRAARAAADKAGMPLQIVD